MRYERHVLKGIDVLAFLSDFALADCIYTRCTRYGVTLYGTPYCLLYVMCGRNLEVPAFRRNYISTNYCHRKRYYSQ